MLRRLTADESHGPGSDGQELHLPDVVYARGPTLLARTSEERGKPLSGFEMLLHQGVGSVHLITGLLVPVEQMRAAGRGV